MKDLFTVREIGVTDIHRMALGKSRDIIFSGEMIS
jgi:hypothetical protein